MMIGPSQPIDRNAVAITTYRRANGSQAQSIKPRVGRTPKTFPRAHTPSPAARLLTRYVRFCNARHGGPRPESEVREAVAVMFKECSPEVLVSLVHSARASMRHPI